MNKLNLSIVLCVLIFCVRISHVFAQNQYANSATLPINIHPVFYQLTDQDRRNYVLTVNQPISIKRDTVVYKFTSNDYHVYQQKEDQIIIPVKFTNNSDDTLMYIEMECSSWDIYLTNNPQIEIYPPNEICYKNGPVVIKIAPKDSSIVNIAVGYPKNMSKETKFRIGMIIQKYDGGLLAIPIARESNTIWSNEIGIP